MALDNNMIQKKPGEQLEEYQSGMTKLSDDEKPKLGSSGNRPRRTYSDLLRSNPLSSTRMEDYTEEAKDAGFGQSRYDTDFYPDMDLEESRAIEQSGFSKIGTGLVKGGITAATTAVNTTLGTVFGLGSSLYELASDSNGNGRSFMDTLDAGVNNWLSNQLVKIQNWAEDALPNYRTAEERSERYQREWWKHMGTANFIGDSVLKNFGFTVGAMVGGMAWSKLLGAALSKQLAGNIMKGAVAAAEGDSEAATLMREAAEAVAKGSATEAQAALARAGEAVARGTAVGIDADALVANIENAAKSLNRYGAKLQLYGAAVSAMGEGTVEGIMAKNEFLEQYNANWERQYAQAYANAENEVLNSGNTDWYEAKAYEMPDGSIRKVKVLTDEGKDEIYRRRQQVTQEFQAAKEYAEQQADRLSSTTFLLNLPILTASNAIQFGRMLSGGWKTSRNAASKGIRGGLQRTADGLTGAYEAIGNVAARTAFGSLKVAGSEAFEEMAQGTVSSGAKEVASRNLASFNNDGFDENAINSFREWFSGMVAGGGEYLDDPKNWQEGAIGALTGLFGIPGRRWNGGVVGEYRDAKDKVETARALAQTLNDNVNSHEFQARWRGYIRHLKYDDGMNRAIKDDDEYAWHTNDDNQLISDVIMFADAGRLSDLEQIVASYSNMSAAEAKSIKEAVESGKEGVEDYSWTKNLSPEDIVGKVKEQATRIQDTINQYRNFYESMSARAPIGASPELIKEMVFTAQQIKAYENRFLTMFGETMTAIEPIIEVQSVFDKSGKMIEDESERAHRFEEIKQSYERIFSMMGLPVRIPRAMREETDKVLDVMEGFAEGDEALQKKIQDMRKLANSRNVFYEKLIKLQGEDGVSQFNEQAATQEQLDNAAVEQMAEVDTEGLDTVDSVRRAYYDKDAKGKIEFLESLEKTESKNPAIKKFMDIKRRVDGFQEYYSKNGAPSGSVAVTPRMLQSMINDFLRRASSVEDVENLPDSMFMPVEKFVQDFSGLIPVSPDVYTDAKQALRDAMKKYVGVDSSTATRRTLSPTPVTPKTATDVTPTGTDSSAPGSAAPAPAAPATPQPAPVPPAASPAPAAPKPQGATGKEVSLTEQVGYTMMAEPATRDSVAADAMVFEKEPVESGDESAEGEIPYLHQSTPEVDSEQQALARSGVEGRMQADLSDFVEKHPEYAETWNALHDAGAFAYIATQLAVGDEIEFVVLPKGQFPYYNDRHQILMATRRSDGELQILTPLSQKNAEYLGLRELRDEIEKEYREHLDRSPNDVFVFSKKSQVWAKRAGQIDYDFSVTDPFANEKGLKDIPGYSDDAPIVFINGMGVPQVVRGDISSLEHLSPNAFNDAFTAQRAGALYYLVDRGDGEMIPVRLFVEHFNEKNSGSNNPVFVKVRSILSGIVDQALNADKVDTDWKAENDKLWKRKQELLKLLCVDHAFFELGNYENIGPALKVTTWKQNEDGEREYEVSFARPDQISLDWLVRKIAEGDFSFQVRQKEEGGTLDNINEYIDNNIITSNAKMLRPKGVDFYAWPYHKESGEFGPATDAQVAASRAAKAAREQKKKEDRGGGMPIIPPGLEGAVIGTSTEDEDIEWANEDFDDTATRKNNPAREVPREAQPSQQPEIQIKKLHELDEALRKVLLDSGWTEETFNAIDSPDVYQRAIECAGAFL